MYKNNITSFIVLLGWLNMLIYVKLLEKKKKKATLELLSTWQIFAIVIIQSNSEEKMVKYWKIQKNNRTNLVVIKTIII